MTQLRMFRLAPAALHLQATFVPGEGWSLRVGMRRQDESWAEAYQAHYDHLSSEELADVICSESEGLL
jgi:hypothetical protein